MYGAAAANTGVVANRRAPENRNPSANAHIPPDDNRCDIAAVVAISDPMKVTIHDDDEGTDLRAVADLDGPDGRHCSAVGYGDTIADDYACAPDCDDVRCRRTRSKPEVRANFNDTHRANTRPTVAARTTVQAMDPAERSQVQVMPSGLQPIHGLTRLRRSRGSRGRLLDSHQRSGWYPTADGVGG